MNTSTQSTLVREINIPIPWENGLPHSETDEWCSLGLHLKCGKLHLELTVELMIYTAVLYFTDFIKHVFKINGDIQPDRERDTHSRECVRGFQVASFPPAREARRSNGDISVNLSLSGVVSFSKRRKSLARRGAAGERFVWMTPECSQVPGRPLRRVYSQGSAEHKNTSRHTPASMWSERHHVERQLYLFLRVSCSLFLPITQKVVMNPQILPKYIIITFGCWAYIFRMSSGHQFPFRESDH